jgi:hypothetical protein
MIPQMTPDDHLAKAVEAEAKADALRRKSAPVARVEPPPEPEPQKPALASRCTVSETQLPLGLTLL